MASKSEIELWLLVENPEQARKYISSYDWGGIPGFLKPDKLMLDSGKLIHFDKMTDDEATLAARTILRDVEVPQSMREKQFVQWEH